MAGFPFFQLDRFLKILVQDLNKYVAISEEFAVKAEDKEKSGGLLFNRRVARIITPGTLIDEKFMDPSENNFILAIYMDVGSLKTNGKQDDLSSSQRRLFSSPAPQRIGLAWLDLSTGDFYTQLTVAQMLPSAITRVGAREVLVDEDVRDLVGAEFQTLTGQDKRLVTFFDFVDEPAPISEWDSMLESPMAADAAASFTPEEVGAGYNLLRYVREQLQGSNVKLLPPRRRHLDQSMGIDRNSMRGLEILETSRDGFGKGSVLHTVRRTATRSGSRLLRDRLTSPSTSLQEVNERLDLVTAFLEDPELRSRVVGLLKQSYDAQRLVQKFSLGRGDADELICLSRSVEASREIKRSLSQWRSVAGPGPIHDSLGRMVDRLHLDGPVALAERILAAIDEESLLKRQRIEDTSAAEAAALAQEVVSNEGLPEEVDTIPKNVKTKAAIAERLGVSESESLDVWIMQRNASTFLCRLHEKLDNLANDKAALIHRLRDSVGSSSLTLKWTPGLGYICHVKGARVSQQSLEGLGVTRNVSSTKSTRSFYLPVWTELGSRMDQVKVRIRQEEQRIFENLRREVILNLVKIRRNASVVDELDVACSFATLAQEQQMVRPFLNESTAHKIVGGRHPTVKLGLEEQGRRFVSNDCFLGDGGPARIWLVTGPTMAGKSTFLRQNALITILAQVGSYVPADYAELGIVDQVFSRVGAADDLFRDQSTFMVEMLETAAILKHATPRSFVIMDEVGRGTTPEDGTAVSFACLHHLHYRNRCRTLFATHFHGLADMTHAFDKLERYCTDVKETPSGSFSFVHRLRKGVNRKSHALKVARLAGLPDETIEMAERVRNEIGELGVEEPVKAAAA